MAPKQSLPGLQPLSTVSTVCGLSLPLWRQPRQCQPRPPAPTPATPPGGAPFASLGGEPGASPLQAATDTTRSSSSSSAASAAEDATSRVVQVNHCNHCLIPSVGNRRSPSRGSQSCSAPYTVIARDGRSGVAPPWAW